VAIYFRSSRLPELEGVPDCVRDEVAEEAIKRVPITLVNASSLAFTMLTVLALFFPVVAILGRWSAYAALGVGACVLHAWFLNAARPLIPKVAQEEWV
jgi:hypothetical protein